MGRLDAGWASTAVLAGSILLSLAAAAPADELAQLDEEHRLSNQVVTPHVEWATPYAKGPVSALFFVSGAGGDSGSFTQMGTRPREIIELMERFDIQPQTVYLQGGILHMKDLGEQRLEGLLRSSYDVYVFASASFDALPEKARQVIAERVERGAGLVCVGPPPPAAIALQPAGPDGFVHSGWPVADLAQAGAVADSLKVEKTAAALLPRIGALSTSGRGRVAHVSYGVPTNALTPYIEFSFPALTEYEYWITFAGRVILWAAGKEPDVELAPVSRLPASISRADLPRTVRVAARGAGTGPRRLDFRVTLRRSDGTAVDLPAERAGASASSVTIPLLPADRYFLDVIASSTRGVETFGSSSFEVTSPRGVDSVTLDRPFVEAPGTINGEVALRGTPSAGDSVWIALRDSYQRIVARQLLAPKAGQPVAFSFRVNEWATILMRVEASLLEDGQEIETKETSFTVPDRKRGRFNFLMWDRPNDVLGYYAFERLRDAGMSVSLVGGAPGPVLAACDYAQVPYTTRILDRFDSNGVMQPVCWNDEPAVQKWVDGIAGKYGPSRQHGVFVYSLGDETTTKGACQFPACLQAYRGYLKQQYGTIEALNSSWGSSYDSFDEVNTLEKTDNYEEAALKKGLLARWYDRNAFARLNFLRLCARFGRAYGELDPKAITGFEGAGRLGDDCDAIIATNGFWTPYPGVADEIIRSIAPRSFIRSNWMGYEKTADPLIATAWRMVTLGYDSIWWWRWDGIGRYHGYLAPDLDFWPATRELETEMRIVRNGLGDLLLNSNPLHDGIAILYSVPSAAAGSLEAEKKFADVEDEHRALVSATKDAGLQLRYVTTRMLEQGALDSGEFDVLVLPFSLALSDAEADAIRRFVEAGGLLIADLRPGLYDQHCKPRAGGVLDELFGIERAGPGLPKEVQIALSATIDEQPVSLKLATTADADVRPAGAEALGRAGGVPILLTHRVGRGRTILLNFQIADYEDQRHTADADSTREFVAALYAVARIKPLLAADPQGPPLRGVEVAQWRAGDGLIVSLFRNPGKWRWTGPQAFELEKPVRARFSLPGLYHVYDLRRHTYMGRTAFVDCTLSMGRASFFALLPHRIPRPSIVVLAAGTPQGGWLLAKVRLPSEAAGGLFAVHVEVRKPDGQPAPWLERVLIARGDSAEFVIPVAFNDPAGVWSIRATELFSGQVAEETYRVDPL